MLQRFRRLLRHRWHDSSTLRRTMPAAALARLTQRVQASEQRHSGEIRIYIEAGLPTTYLWRRGGLKKVVRERALALFGKLRVWDTEHNNGVLIYLLLAERAIEIVADRGVNQHVTKQQWHAMVERMGAAFRDDRFEDGLTQALAEVSSVLVQHFALAKGDANPNELPDAPVVGPS